MLSEVVVSGSRSRSKSRSGGGSGRGSGGGSGSGGGGGGSASASSGSGSSGSGSGRGSGSSSSLHLARNFDVHEMQFGFRCSSNPVQMLTSSNPDVHRVSTFCTLKMRGLKIGLVSGQPKVPEDLKEMFEDMLQCLAFGSKAMAAMMDDFGSF